MQSAKSFIEDQLKFAKDGADNLARRSGYRWINWRKGKAGLCTAGFDREGKTWSFDFYWTPKEELSVLANNIERMDYMMRVSMKEFGALKMGAMMRQLGAGAVQ